MLSRDRWILRLDLFMASLAVKRGAPCAARAACTLRTRGASRASAAASRRPTAVSRPAAAVSRPAGRPSGKRLELSLRRALRSASRRDLPRGPASLVSWRVSAPRGPRAASAGSALPGGDQRLPLATGWGTDMRARAAAGYRERQQLVLELMPISRRRCRSPETLYPLPPTAAGVQQPTQRRPRSGMRAASGSDLTRVGDHDGTDKDRDHRRVDGTSRHEIDPDFFQPSLSNHVFGWYTTRGS